MTDQRVCAECGEELAEGVAFCDMCGARVLENGAEAETATPAESNEAPPTDVLADPDDTPTVIGPSLTPPPAATAGSGADSSETVAFVRPAGPSMPTAAAPAAAGAAGAPGTPGAPGAPGYSTPPGGGVPGAVPPVGAYGVAGQPGCGAQPGYGTPPPQPPRRGGQGRVLLGIAAAVLVIAGFIAGMFLLGGGDDTEQVSASDSPSTSASSTAPDGNESGRPTPTVGTPVPVEGQGGGDDAAGAGGSSDQQRQGESSARAVAPAQPEGRSDEGGSDKGGPDERGPDRGGSDDAATEAEREPENPGYVSYSQATALTSQTSQPFTHAVAAAYADSGAGGKSVELPSVYSPRTGKSYKMTCTAQSDGSVICIGGRNNTARVRLHN